jgi:hypothetical protein
MRRAWVRNVRLTLFLHRDVARHCPFSPPYRRVSTAGKVALMAAGLAVAVLLIGVIGVPVGAAVET